MIELQKLKPGAEIIYTIDECRPTEAVVSNIGPIELPDNTVHLYVTNKTGYYQTLLPAYTKVKLLSNKGFIK